MRIGIICCIPSMQNKKPALVCKNAGFRWSSRIPPVWWNRKSNTYIAGCIITIFIGNLLCHGNLAIWRVQEAVRRCERPKTIILSSHLSSSMCATRLHNAPGDPNRVVSSPARSSCPDTFLVNLESRFSQLSKASQIDTWLHKCSLYPIMRIIVARGVSCRKSYFLLIWMPFL